MRAHACIQKHTVPCTNLQAQCAPRSIHTHTRVLRETHMHTQAHRHTCRHTQSHAETRVHTDTHRVLHTINILPRCGAFTTTDEPDTSTVSLTKVCSLRQGSRWVVRSGQTTTHFSHCRITQGGSPGLKPSGLHLSLRPCPHSLEPLIFSLFCLFQNAW